MNKKIVFLFLFLLICTIGFYFYKKDFSAIEKKNISIFSNLIIEGISNNSILTEGDIVLRDSVLKNQSREFIINEDTIINETSIFIDNEKVMKTKKVEMKIDKRVVDKSSLKIGMRIDNIKTNDDLLKNSSVIAKEINYTIHE